MKITPVITDGALYYLIAAAGSLQTSLTQDTVKAVIPDPWLTLLIVINGAFLLAGLTALKTFRSTAYAKSVHDDKPAAAPAAKPPTP